MTEEHESWVQRPVRRLPRPPRVPPHPPFPGDELTEGDKRAIAKRLSGDGTRKFGSGLETAIVKFKKDHGIESRKTGWGTEKIDKETWDAIFTRPTNTHEPFQAVPITEEEMQYQKTAFGGIHGQNPHTP